MKVSQARINANRRNALLSTGPKTAEGKERSRANALKHGLCSSVIVPESVELIQSYACEWFETLKPQNDFHAWLVDRIAIISIRIDRCERMERRFRDRQALRAEVGWDDDRRSEAEALGGQIGRNPAAVVDALRRTPQGCDWLMSRWAMLAHSADVKGAWSPEQSRLAFDLLGTPNEFREGHKPGVLLDFDGRVIASADDPAIVARREIAALNERREAVSDLDEVDRSLTESDLSDESHPELIRLRRYEGMLHGRLRWCLSQMRFVSPNRFALKGFQPRWVVPPAPTAETESADLDPPSRESLQPPFDLEPDEVPTWGEKVDVPAILASRHQKQIQKAEARREARRRKLEELRA